MKRLLKIKFKDPLIIWAAAGIIGVITRDIYSFFAKQIGFAKFNIWLVGSALLVEKSDVMTFWGNIVGFLVDAIVGSILGITLGFFLRWRGKSYYILKGWGAGVFAWLFMYGLLFHNLPFTKESAPKDALSNLSAFVGHSIFGIATVIAYVKWLSKYEVTNSEKANKRVDWWEKEKKELTRYRFLQEPAKKIELREKRKVKFKKPTKL